MHVQETSSDQASAGICGQQGARRAEAATTVGSGAGQQKPANAAGAAQPAYPQPSGGATGGLSSVSLAAVLTGQESGASAGVGQWSHTIPSRQALELTMLQAVQSYLPPVQAQPGIGITA